MQEYLKKIEWPDQKRHWKTLESMQRIEEMEKQCKH